MDIEEVAKIAQEQIDKENAGNPSIKKMMKVVKEFIQQHRVMCYGGTAINNLLAPEDQFYDFSVDIPDYDFFSETPQMHAAKLADRLAKVGFGSVEVKPGVHLGTFKVFADYIGVADISHLDKPIFQKLWEGSIEKDGMHYVPPNYLRMAVYLELSRPKGDVSRWKKVYNRLQKLNKAHPLVCPKEDDTPALFLTDEVREEIKNKLKEHKVVLLGFNASMLQTTLKGSKKWMLPLDILSVPEQRQKVVTDFKTYFDQFGKIKVTENPAYGELLPPHSDIVESKSGTLLMRVYETNACHSYNESPSGLYVASVPTLLQFFLAVLYASKDFKDPFPEQRFLCTAEHLINVANEKIKRRYQVLTPITCLGKQPSLIDMRAEKSELYNKLSSNRNSREFMELFFTYTPTDLNTTQRQKVRRSLRKTLKH